MHVLIVEPIVKSSGGDQVYEPNLKSLAKVVIGICANHEIFFCLSISFSYLGMIDGTLKPRGSSDGWT